MRVPVHPFFLWVFGVVLGMALVPAAAFAGRDVVCESIDDRPAHCDVGWPSAVMTRQMSRSACIRGDTWGIDRGVIWVDRGCRASFVRAHTHDIHVDEYGDDSFDRWDGAFRRGWDRRDRDRRAYGIAAPRERFEQTVECSSIDKRYTFCPAGGNNRSGRLVSRRSEADCREGKGWGWNADGVWVSRGCRGVFAVEGGGR